MCGLSLGEYVCALDTSFEWLMDAKCARRRYRFIAEKKTRNMHMNACAVRIVVDSRSFSKSKNLLPSRTKWKTAKKKMIEKRKSEQNKLYIF